MDPGKLKNSDREILTQLETGRCTPRALADWTGFSKTTVHNRLNVLVAAGYVEKAHESGLYELVKNPLDK